MIFIMSGAGEKLILFIFDASGGMFVCSLAGKNPLQDKEGAESENSTKKES